MDMGAVAAEIRIGTGGWNERRLWYRWVGGEMGGGSLCLVVGSEMMGVFVESQSGTLVRAISRSPRRLGVRVLMLVATCRTRYSTVKVAPRHYQDRGQHSQ